MVCHRIQHKRAIDFEIERERDCILVVLSIAPLIVLKFSKGLHVSTFSDCKCLLPNTNQNYLIHVDGG